MTIHLPPLPPPIITPQPNVVPAVVAETRQPFAAQQVPAARIAAEVAAEMAAEMAAEVAAEAAAEQAVAHAAAAGRIDVEQAGLPHNPDWRFELRRAVAAGGGRHLNEAEDAEEMERAKESIISFFVAVSRTFWNSCWL